jgi:hypothetical protein
VPLEQRCLRLAASWELDLFGRQRAALDAAIGQQRAAEADAQAARVLLAGSWRRAGSRWRASWKAAAPGRARPDQREQVLALVRQRIAAGLDTRGRAAPGRGAGGAVAGGAAGAGRGHRARPPRAGRTERPAAAGAGHADRVAGPAARPAAARPLGADLLGRRADLVAQRWRVEAALRDVDVARAQFYPNVNLVAFVGLSSLGLDKLLNAGARTWGAGPALRLPVFDGGRLRAQLAARRPRPMPPSKPGTPRCCARCARSADEVATLQALQRQQQAQAQATAPPKPPLRWRCSATRPAWATSLHRADGRRHGAGAASRRGRAEGAPAGRRGGAGTCARRWLPGRRPASAAR